MSWLNEIEWSLLLLLIMKLALVWAVAAYVVAAELPCDDYCVCVSTGIGNVAHQPECDCMKGDSRVMAQLDDSGIYYEPAEYFPAPTFFYGQPFFILNPYVALKRKRVPQASKPRITPHNTNPNDQIEMNLDSTLNSHRRKEKDTDSVTLNNKKSSIYLDIDMPEDSERSASNILNQEDFQKTERNLLECVDLYTVLDYRKHGNPDFINAKSIIAKYQHQSDADLISKIDSKCSQIADIVQRSLKEIKETRPKKIHATFRMLDQEHMTDLQRNNKPLSTTTQIIDTKKVTLESPNNVNSEDLGKADEDATIEEKTVVIYTDSASEENMEDNQITLHTNASVTDDQRPPMKTERTTPSQTDSMHTTTEYPIYTETNPLLSLPTAASSTYDMGSTNIVEEHFVESRQSNNQYSDTDTNGNESRPGYKDDKAPLLKVFTQEFGNNTVKSFINGTENTYNRDFDFDTESKPTEEATTSFNAGIIETSSLKDDMKDKSPDVTGNLFFLYNKHHLPAKFVQTPNGTLHVGIDGGSLCDKVQDGEHKSALLTALCKCYKSGDCPNKK